MLRIFLIIILLPWKSLGQASKKEMRYERTKLQAEAVRQGQYLDRADRVPVEKFMEYYLEVGPQHYSKQYGQEYMNELYVDSQYIYFGHYAGPMMIKFVKVSREELAGINYNAIDGRVIRERFIKEIVPQADKDRVEKKDKACTMGYYFTEFSYKYLPATKEVEVSYRWKINCEFLYKIINKTYTSRYSFDTGLFSE